MARIVSARGVSPKRRTISPRASASRQLANARRRSSAACVLSLEDERGAVAWSSVACFPLPRCGGSCEPERPGQPRQGGRSVTVRTWQVVKQLREARGGTTRLKGRPFYAYRISQSEFDELRTTLTQDLRGTSELPHEVAAGFCLFAAEYVRREYDGTVWSWDPLLRAIGFDGSIGPSYEILERTLRAEFGLDLLRGRRGGNIGAREFLLTLMCQGGLPLALLRRESSYLLSYLRWLLDERARSDARRGTGELAVEASELLPRALRNGVVFQLASDLVDAVTSLRSRLKGAEDPVAQLDRLDAAWREKVPLSLDDDSARALLVELLRHVPRQASVRAGIRVTTVLRRLSPTVVRLERRALLLGRHPKRQLAELFGQEDRDLPLRFFVDMISADGARQQVGTAQQVAGESEYEVLDLRSRPISRPEAVTGEVLLLARTSTEELGVFQPEGGQALADVPWWFTDEPDRDEQQFVGQADLVTRRTSLLAVTPSGVKIDGAEIQAVGTLEAPTASIQRVRGACTWTSEDDRGAARIGAPEDIAPVILVGDIRISFTAGMSAWFGPPTLAARDGSPTLAHLEWRRPDGTWERVTESCVGRVALRAIQDGVTLLRTTATILPRDLELKSYPRAGEGTLRVRSRRLHGLSVEDCPSTVHATISHQNATAELHVVANESVDLKLRLSFDGGTTALVSAPLPVIAMCFVDRRGQPLPTGQQVSTQRLHGIRARIVTAGEEEAPTLLARRLLTDAEPSRVQTIGVLRATRDQRIFELPLDDVRDAILEHLAVGTHPDDAVELVLAPSAVATLFVRRYEAAFSLDAPGLAVRRLTLPTDVATKIEPHVAEALDVSLLRIANPAVPETSILRDADGSWHFVAADHAPGPWLVVARYGNAIRLRPVTITNRRDEIDPGEPGTLKHALLCPARGERFKRLLAYFQALVPRFEASDWASLRPFVATLGQFPATTFDVMPRIASQGVLAAYALLKADDGSFMRVWNGLEELPFVWHLVPVTAWVKAARVLYHDRRRETAELKKLNIPVTLGDPLLPWRANPFARFLAVLQDLFAATVVGVDEPPDDCVRKARDPDARALVLERLMLTVAPLQQEVRTEIAEDLARELVPVGGVLRALVELQEIVSHDGHRRPALSAGTFLKDFGARLDGTPTPAGRVAYAAALTAAYAYSGERASYDLLFRLRGYRSAAYELFDMAHATYLTLLLGARLAKDKEYLDDV